MPRYFRVAGGTGLYNIALQQAHFCQNPPSTMLKGHSGGKMSALQTFFLGIMVAWTPSLLLLAWMLWRNTVSGDHLKNPQH